MSDETENAGGRNVRESQTAQSPPASKILDIYLAAIGIVSLFVFVAGVAGDSTTVSSMLFRCIAVIGGISLPVLAYYQTRRLSAGVVLLSVPVTIAVIVAMRMPGPFDVVSEALSRQRAAKARHAAARREDDDRSRRKFEIENGARRLASALAAKSWTEVNRICDAILASSDVATPAQRSEALVARALSAAFDDDTAVLDRLAPELLRHSNGAIPEPPADAPEATKAALLRLNAALVRNLGAYETQKRVEQVAYGDAAVALLNVFDAECGFSSIARSRYEGSKPSDTEFQNVGVRATSAESSIRAEYEEFSTVPAAGAEDHRAAVIDLWARAQDGFRRIRTGANRRDTETVYVGLRILVDLRQEAVELGAQASLITANNLTAPEKVCRACVQCLIGIELSKADLEGMVLALANVSDSDLYQWKQSVPLDECAKVARLETSDDLERRAAELAKAADTLIKEIEALAKNDPSKPERDAVAIRGAKMVAESVALRKELAGRCGGSWAATFVK